MIHIHQSRTYSLQILKNNPTSSRETLRPLQKDAYTMAEKSYSSKKERTITQIVKEHSQLKLALNKISKDTIQFIDKISTRKNVKIPFKINYKQHLEHNNQKIESLYTQIKRTENHLHFFSDNSRQNKKMHSIQQHRRSQLKNSIKYLNRKIDKNSKQLIEQQHTNSFIIFDLQKQILQLNIRLKHIHQKNNNAVQKNESKIQKIKQIQAKIMDYQSSNILAQIQQQNRKQSEYLLKMKQLQKLKVTSTRQRSRLQHLYFRKLKDFQYEIACCEAIDHKIEQLQKRIVHNQMDNQGEVPQSPQKLLKIVNSHRILKKDNRFASEPSLNNEQSSGQFIKDTSTLRKPKQRQNTTVQVKKWSHINNMEEIKKRRLMSGIQAMRKNQ